MLEQLRARNPKVQMKLRKRLFAKVSAVCRHMLKDPLLAEEIAEDIWMDFIFDHVDKVRAEAALGAYLRTMTVRRCVRVRDFRARHESYVESGASVRVPELDPEGEAVAGLDRERMKGRLQLCLDGLSEKVRKIMRMRFHLQMTQAQIGQGLGVSKQYAGRVLNKGLAALRLCLEEGK